MPLGGLLLITSYQSQMERWVTFLGWNWGQIPRVQIQKSHLNRAVQIHNLRTKKSGTSHGTNKSVRPLKRLQRWMDLKAMVRKQQLESSQIAIHSDYSMENDGSVSSSGWIGLLLQVYKPI